MNKISVKTKNKKYSIFVGENLIGNFSSILKKEKIFLKKCLIVVDKNVPTKLISKLKKNLQKKEVYYFIFNANEKNKNLLNINKILDKLFLNNFNRNDSLISLGGGITGDVSGYAASIYKRGIKFINIPTTLLAQVDSSIGGKTGVNNKYGKNLIGTFYQPDLVVSDIIFLKSLPIRELICGYAEILKHSLISSKKNFFFLERFQKEIIKLKKKYIVKAIVESCKIKKSVVEKDENEKSIRKILNFGHTFAHAYEATLGYSKKLNHGEAVILGIKTAIKFSLVKNILNVKDYNFILNHINNLSYKIYLNKYFRKRNVKMIIKFMKTDKKNKSKKINLILIKSIGKPKYNLDFNVKDIEIFLSRELK